MTEMQHTYFASVKLSMLLTGAAVGAIVGVALSVVAWVDSERRDLARLVLLAWTSSLPVVMGILLTDRTGSGLALLLAPLSSLLSYVYMRSVRASAPPAVFILRALIVSLTVASVGGVIPLVKHLLRAT
jgi:hypothetical protein